jgi:hypothetical protein
MAEADRACSSMLLTIATAPEISPWCEPNGVLLSRSAPGLITSPAGVLAIGKCAASFEVFDIVDDCELTLMRRSLASRGS